MAIPTPEALQRYWNWFYEQNKGEIEKQILDAMITGRSFVKMTERGAYRRDYWNEVFNIQALPEDNEPEPVICGFGEAAMYSQELKKRLDDIPVPTTAAQLEAALGDRQDMFHAMPGIPRAYMEIPTGFPQDGGYRMPSVLRVVYKVLAYKKTCPTVEMAHDAEPELVACMWDDFKRIRVRMAEEFGEMTPVLFWRREPEFSVEHDEGSKVAHARIYLRLDIPGYDWRNHPVISQVGDNSLDKPWPAPVSAAQKDEMLFADEVLRLSEAASKAHDAHFNAFQKLINMRSQHVAEEVPVRAFGLYGQPAAPSQEEQMKVTGAMRGLLDSQAIASTPPREDLVRIQEQLDKLGD